MNIKEDDFLEKYHPVVRRLQKATSEQAMRNKMQLEDDFVSELTEYERMIDEARKQAQQATKQAQEATKQIQEEKEKKEQLKQNMVKNCFKKGMSVDGIAQLTGLVIAKVKEILKA